MAYLSIHTAKSRDVARAKGAFAGDDSAVGLWELSKREILEVALRLTIQEKPSEAVQAFQNELALLRTQGIV